LKNQSLIEVKGNIYRCLFWDPYKARNCTVWAGRRNF